ncbi:MAG: DNA-3-methyladenine glycosylase 2 family protein [Negativicutes bacterium]|nr:DNA-3-methyladenine glycosylase 2 family protein [Negativicutes bacterium]
MVSTVKTGPGRYHWQAADEHLAAADPVMAGLISRFAPCTLNSRHDPFALLCQAVIAQQLSSRAAMTIYRRFCDSLGGRPTAGRLAETADDSLRAIGLSRQKIACLRDLARQTLSGYLRFADYRQMPPGEVIASLTAVRGIGLWTAQMFLMFAINHPDVLPGNDLGIIKAVQQHYRLADRPDRQRLEAIADVWRPYRTIACWYLWRSTDDLSSSW